MTNTERIQANNEELRKSIEMAETLPDVSVDGGDPYEGEYVVTPKVNEQTLPTKQKVMLDDMTVLAIPYAEVTNVSNGKTVTIG